jgi:hypothetical protein
MYFPNIDHYFHNDYCDGDENYNHKFLTNINDCMICLEPYDVTNNNCIKLQNVFYIKNCFCDAWIHHYCLDIWFNNNNKCPICLCRMAKKNKDELNIEDEIHYETHDEIHYDINNLFRSASYFCLLFCFLYNLITIIILFYEVAKK